MKKIIIVLFVLLNISFFSSAKKFGTACDKISVSLPAENKSNNHSGGCTEASEGFFDLSPMNFFLFNI